jgi:N-acetylglucosamine malate deacetylase 1
MKIIVFIAHPDDEINCAGLLTKNKDIGGESLVLCFTGNKKRNKELEKSCKILGAKAIHLGYDNYKIPYSKEIRNKLSNTIRKFKPDIAVVQSNDYHLDHKRVHKISLDILEFASHEKNGWLPKKIFEMEATGLFQYPDIILDITKEFPKKIAAFNSHQTQVSGKSFGNTYLEMTKAKANLRGVQIGQKYGEGFKIHHLSIKGNFYNKSRGIKNIKEILQ